MRLLCNLCQQRLCRGDLGHFRRRREAFERRAESGVRVGVAAVCVIELGERQRAAQLEAAGTSRGRISAADADFLGNGTSSRSSRV
jgi:hypothetical protein